VVVALITGSAGGIESYCKKFAEEGACIVINDVNVERLSETNKEFRSSFGMMLSAVRC
jgi:NAD(P)-dependent dehydrogenase (short-subunit alcohol dehydrogenase family)